MSENVNPDKNLELTPAEIEYLLDKKYRKIYSERLGRKVYTLVEWVDKPIFKRHKKLFGYTDIGWTVKHPKQLIRTLIKEGVWEFDPEIRKELAAYSQEQFEETDQEHSEETNQDL